MADSAVSAFGYFSKQIDSLKKATIDGLKGDVCCVCPQKPIESYYALAGERTKAGMAAVGLAESLTSCTCCAKLFCPKHAQAGIWRRVTDKYTIPEELYARPVSKGLLGSLSTTAASVAAQAKTVVVGATRMFACDEQNATFGRSCRSHLIHLWVQQYQKEMRGLLRVDALLQFVCTADPHLACSQLAYARPTSMADDRLFYILDTTYYILTTIYFPTALSAAW
ncbi:hypothetical protein B484DRAFT_79777 [Ochromonadaceae sp. CCMP2298]|nr:hypothetical protein B484DRAFT_79777 [Ochromonadaceae sp. CCMP2298]